MPIQIITGDELVLLTVPIEPYLKTAPGDNRAMSRWRKAGFSENHVITLLQERWRKREEKAILGSPEIQFLISSNLQFKLLTPQTGIGPGWCGITVPEHYVYFLSLDANAAMMLKLAFA